MYGYRLLRHTRCAASGCARAHAVASAAPTLVRRSVTLYVLSSARRAVNLPGPWRASTFRPVSFDYDPSDPPSPFAVVRGVLGGALVVATALLIVVYLDSGEVDPRFAALVGALWVLWGAFHDLIGWVVAPLAGFLGGQVTGTTLDDPSARIDIDRETAMLEQLVADPPPVPHREILAGIRLAEIYRTHQHDDAKSAALLARLRAKYPDAPELRYDP